MKKISILLGLAFAMLATACTKDAATDVVGTKGSRVFKVGIAEDSRTSLGTKDGDTYPVLWSAGDRINVNGIESEDVDATCAGTGNGSFVVKDLPEAATYNVVYPASAYSADLIVLPAVQHYTANSFDSAASVLLAKADNTAAYVTLKHACGYVKVPVKQASGDNYTVAALVFRALGSELVSGTFTPDYAAATLTGADGSNFVRLAVENVALSTTATDFIITIPAGTYSAGFSVQIITTDNKVMTATAYSTGKTVTAGRIIAMSELTYEPDATVTEIRTAADLQAFAEAVNAGDYSAWKNTKGEVVLGNDIDLTDATITPVASFDGTFDGQGFALKNWKSDGTALFTAIAAGATVKNVTIDTSSTMNVSTETAGNKGFIAATCAGTIEGCINNAAITFAADDLSLTEQYKIGAIVGVTSSTALIDNCVNNGNVTITIGSMTASSYYFGGVAGNTSGASGVICMKECVNSGDVTVYVDGANGWKNVYLGGCVGCCNSNGIVQGCTNSGKVDFYLDKAQSGAYPNVGGITGYTAAEIQKCTNSGDVAIRTRTFASADALPQITRPAVGGICGYTSKNISGCFNYGHILLQGTADVMFGATTSYTSGGVGSMGRPVIGGVCGSAGYPAVAASGSVAAVSVKNVTVSDCHNYGFVELDNPSTATWMPIGGVVGMPTGTVENCTNEAQAVVKVTMGGAQTYLGGVLGTTMQKATVYTNCKNFGKVWFAASAVATTDAFKDTTRSYAGGVTGGYNAGSGNIGTSCVNYGEVLAEANQTMIVAGVFACHNGTATDCENAGNITVKNAFALSAGVTEVGGIAGYANADLSGCVESGSITVTDCEAGLDVGSLIGAQGGAKTITGRVGGTITAKNANVGIVLGSTRAAKNAVTLGSAAEPLTVKLATEINGATVTTEDAADAKKLMGRTPAGASLVLTNVVTE